MSATEKERSQNKNEEKAAAWSALSSIGILLAGLAFLIFAATYFMRPPQAGGIVYPEYQLVQSSIQGEGSLLLHANGGHVWKQVCFGGEYKDSKCSGVMIWQEMYIENLTASDNPIAKRYNDIVNKNAAQQAPK